MRIVKLSAVVLPVVVLGQGAATDPAIARDGRLAVSVDGDLYVRSSARAGAWRQVTRGPAWDRQPTWSPDGRWLVFSSTRAAGNEDLWRLAIDRLEARGVPERLTTDPAPDVEPTVAADGSVLFVRGRLSQARLWQRAAAGAEKRLTNSPTAERWPAVAPDGRRVAYVQVTEAGRRLRLRSLDGPQDTVVTAERNPERPVWAPDGTRLAFSSSAPRPGIFVTPLDGHYVNYVSGRRGDAAWVPGSSSLLVLERTSDDAGYNGDPDRLGDRALSERFVSTANLYVVTVPASPDAETVATATVAVDRATRNAEAFDRFADRVERLYFASAASASRRVAWREVVGRWRSTAVSALSDSALELAMHRALGERPPLRDAASGRAAVSSAHPVATEAGLEILRAGGNVVDAAVAVSFALGVVEPDASGIGGYGEMLVHRAGSEQPALIEFMARAPEEATLANATLLTDGRYPADGPILAMVPGTVAAMHLAWKRYGSGKVPWATLLAPAIRAAREGYLVSDGLATTLSRERDRFAKYESSRAVFFVDGRPKAAGDTIRNPDLAWTLDQIAKGGADGFYRGEVARRLVSDLRGKGNAIRLTDLSRYFAADREAVGTTYRGYSVYGSAPPASGGTTLAAQLNGLEQVAIGAGRDPRARYTDDAPALHAMITAWQLTPTSRGRVADPALWPTDISPFVSKDTARTRWKCFDPRRALTPAAFRGDTLRCDVAPAASPPGGDLTTWSPSDPCDAQEHAASSDCRPQGTTAFAVADAEGNAVSVTQTLGTWGGNFYVTPGLGFLYNDKLTSYGTDPAAYGARLPGARHGSTLSPTIVLSGEGAARRPVLALGAAGNAWITAAVYQALVGVIDFGLSPQQALELPRFLPSQRGTNPGPPGLVTAREFVIDVEDGFSPDALRQLRAMGHRFNLISLKGELRMGYGAAIAVGRESVTAGADPRRSGAAGAVR